MAHTKGVDDARVAELAEQLSFRSLFVGLSQEQSVALVRRAELLSFQPGQAVVKEGELGDAMFVVLGGSVRVVKNGKAVAIIEGGDSMGVQYQGDFFGEMSLVDLEPRSATIEAHENAELLKFPRDPLLEYLITDKDAHIVLLSNIARIVSRRLRGAGTPPPKP